MSLVLLDCLSLPGNPARPNEDAFAHDANAALAMDGATPLGEPLMPGSSDAHWLAQFGARRLMAHLKDGDAAKDALAHALADAQKSFEALRRHPPREKWQLPCASMMLVCDPLRPSQRQGSATGTFPASADACGGGGPAQGLLDFFWFGDCSALVGNKGGCQIVGDAFDRRGQEAGRARQVAKERNLAPAVDLNRPEILDLLRASRGRINSGQNWLFSPDARAAAHAAHRQMKTAPGDLLLLASDGFLALATDYGAYDAPRLLEAARAKGLAALGGELRAIENDDAGGEKFARFKKSDDATAMLMEVS